MKLLHRIKAGMFDFVTRIAPARPVEAADLARDHRTSPGGKGLRFTERLRRRCRPRWLRTRKQSTE